MRLCELSLATPQENLACDEALLELSEEGSADEVLRFWQPSQYFVVVGYANKVATEVNVDVCRRNGIAVLRRCSGGGTVLQGPGCLNYSLILRIEDGSRRSISETNEEVLHKHQAALSSLLSAPVEKQGQTDLTIGARKFSGNAQRRKLRFLLFHGSFLLDFDLGLVEKVLPMPSQQPAYRVNRSHTNFLMNLGVHPQAVMTALARTWDATEPAGSIPLKAIERLVNEKYSQPGWNARF